MSFVFVVIYRFGALSGGAAKGVRIALRRPMRHHALYRYAAVVVVKEVSEGALAHRVHARAVAAGVLPCPQGATFPRGPQGSLRDDPGAYADSGQFVVQSATVNVLIAYRILSTDPAQVAAAKSGAKMSRLGDQPGPVRFRE